MQDDQATAIRRSDSAGSTHTSRPTSMDLRLRRLAASHTADAAHQRHESPLLENNIEHLSEGGDSDSDRSSTGILSVGRNATVRRERRHLRSILPSWDEAPLETDVTRVSAGVRLLLIPVSCVRGG
jgi:hypothetical protein